VLTQGRFEGRPPLIIAQLVQDACQGVITPIQGSHWLIDTALQRRQAVLHPRLHMIEPVIGKAQRMWLIT
jgi:hypothetical protein